MEPNVRVGLIGTGMMGRVHAVNIAENVKGAELVAVADIDIDGASTLAQQVGGPKIHADGRDLIEDDDIDAVVIASPDPTHSGFVLAALAAGKPVLCEKPLATAADEALAIIRAESALGRRMVQVGFMRQFDNAHAAVRRAVTDGDVGQPVMFRGVHINPTIGGARISPAATIYGAIIHDIHSARFLMNQEITSVYVTHAGMDLTDRDSCRVLTVSLTFADGSLGLIDVNVEAAYGYMVTAEVIGTAGTAATMHRGHFTLYRDGDRREGVTANFQDRFRQAYLDELTAWIRSIRTGPPTGPSSWDGYAATAVADACCESVRTAQPVRPSLIEQFGLYRPGSDA